MKFARLVGRELGYLLFFAFLSLVLLPLLVLLSVALFQTPSAGWEASMDFLAAVLRGVPEGQRGSWVVLFGPYALFLSVRLLRRAWAAYREKTRRRRVERAR